MSLVRKRPLDLVAASLPYYKRARLAYSLASSYGPKAYRMGRRIYRAYRGYRRRKRARARIVGARQKATRAEEYSFGASNSFVPLDRKTLAANVIKFCDPPGDNDELRSARQMTFHVSGFKLCCTFRNVNSSFPIHVHMAIVQPKQPNINISTLKGNMLTDDSNGNDRYQNWVDASTSAFWDRGVDCANLNTEKFNVFMHKRMKLAASGGTTDVDPNRSSWIHFEKYFKINKKFQFETTTATDPMRPLWCLVWYETIFPTNSTGINALEFIVSHISYTR